jgi:hypothetical protein
MRPYVRQQPPRRPGEERFERPDRPRLNRETVDRAWENGAQINHADYHPRNNNRQSRPGSQYGQRGRNSSGYRRDYDYAPNEREREDSDRRNDRQHYSPRNSGPRSRSYNNGRFDEQRSNSNRKRDQYERSDFRRNSRSNDRSYSRREDGQGYASRPSRYGERENRSSHYSERGQRPYHNGPQHETRTPRRNNYRQHEHGQFEGDYERFHSFEDHPDRRQAGTRRFERRQPEERHVTRLPDGRVLKGPRPAQRKNARFWSEIAEDTDTLVPQAHEDEQAEQGKQKPAASPRKGEKKAGSEPKSEKDVPRPSQRGFKWPKPEA